MRLPFASRILIAAGAVALTLALAGCESFDPSSLTDWIPDTKKKLAGDRKDVFPEGVPGVPQGVPRELVKGNQPPPDAAPSTEQAEPAQVVEEKPKPKPKPRPKKVASPRPQQPQAQQPAKQGDATPWPAPPAPTTSTVQTPWPAPPPVGTVTR